VSLGDGLGLELTSGLASPKVKEGPAIALRVLVHATDIRVTRLAERAGILPSDARKGRSRPRRGWPRPASAFAVGAIGYIMWDLAKSSFTINQAS